MTLDDYLLALHEGWGADNWGLKLPAPPHEPSARELLRYAHPEAYRRWPEHCRRVKYYWPRACRDCGESFRPDIGMVVRCRDCRAKRRAQAS